MPTAERSKPIPVRRTILCIAATFLWATHNPDTASGRSSWQSYKDAGVEAYVEGDYIEAEKQLEAAVKAAEAFGQGDPRLATSLSALAKFYRNQARHLDADASASAGILHAPIDILAQHIAVSTRLVISRDLHLLRWPRAYEAR